MAHYRSRPPANKQNLTYFCWAAALNLFSLKSALAVYGVKVDLLAILSLPYDIEDRLLKSHVVLARHYGCCTEERLQ